MLGGPWGHSGDTLTLIAGGEAVLGDELVLREAGGVFGGGGHRS
ncbi:hypothetical protein [Streptomyces sp. GbtcB6]|nr:hypothetical protein [Streptomyces sp. GbtcB6]